MTRISATIKPEELCDKMLLAEHREIVRIPNTIKSGKARVENIPDKFTLGKGHVKFFYNKLAYLYERYVDIRVECHLRGFNVQDYSLAFVGVPKNLLNNWDPDESIVRPILVQRINERLSTMKSIKYKSKDISLNDMLLK